MAQLHVLYTYKRINANASVMPESFIKLRESMHRAGMCKLVNVEVMYKDDRCLMRVEPWVLGVTAGRAGCSYRLAGP